MILISTLGYSDGATNPGSNESANVIDSDDHQAYHVDLLPVETLAREHQYDQHGEQEGHVV
jgi:hypothetical protein